VINKTVTLNLPAKMADELQLFIHLSGLTDGEALQRLLPTLEPIVSSPDELEAVIQSQYELTIEEPRQLDARLATHFCGD
jgi:hypothetical protein